MYALTGAGGQLGRLMVENMLARVPANQIIATTRNPEKLADFAARGVIVRQADLNNPPTLPTAFEGATRLFIISIAEFGKQPTQNRAAIEAGLKAGVKHLFYTSAPRADTGLDHWLLKDFGETEILLRKSGVKWTALRNNIYSNLLPWVLGSLLDDGIIYTLAGPGRPVWISREDCARVAALTLIGDGSITGPVEITGPEALGFADLAVRLSQLLGQKIVTQVLPEEELAARLTNKGLPQQAVSSLLRVVQWLTQGDFGPATGAVELITGSQPEPVDIALKTLISN